MMKKHLLWIGMIMLCVALICAPLPVAAEVADAGAGDSADSAAVLPDTGDEQLPNGEDELPEGSDAEVRPGTRLFLDEREIFLYDPVHNLSGRTYLPLRSFGESLGADVIWNQAQNSVSLVRDRVEVIFTVGSGQYTVNGIVMSMADAALYHDPAIDRTYVPIRYGAEAFGFLVEWIGGDGIGTVQIWSTLASDGALSDNEINVGGKTVWIGQKEEQLVLSFGYPDRVDESAYGMQWYVYNQDYTEFVMVGIRNQRVRGFFSNSISFELRGGLGYGAAKQAVEAAGYRGTMEFWFDPHDDDKLFAVLCMDVFPGIIEQHALFYQNPELLLRTYDIECFDITNAFRVANGKPAVRYHEHAARVALAYARDMADRNFMDHIDPEGRNPLDRLEAQGIYAYRVSENLAGGFNNAMYAVKAWVESESHRQGMLEENQYLGVGAHYRSTSRYGFYFVQKFITLDPPSR